MQRSVAKILTTHVGSLPFLTLETGVASGDESRLAEDVAAIVARQRDIGIDIVNEGEYAKGGDWLRYMQRRFGGFTDIEVPEGKPLVEQGKDREEFADFYKYANERGTLFYAPGAQIAKKRPVQVCTAPSAMSAGRACRKKSTSPWQGRRNGKRVPHVDRAGEASKSIATIATTRTTRNMSSRSPRRCASNTRPSPPPA